MIATFSPPIKSTALKDSLPRIIIASTVIKDLAGEDKVLLMTVNMDGEIGFFETSELIVDWRYDVKTQLWGDVGEESEQQEGSDDGSDEA